MLGIIENNLMMVFDEILTRAANEREKRTGSLAGNCCL